MTNLIERLEDRVTGMQMPDGHLGLRDQPIELQQRERVLCPEAPGGFATRYEHEVAIRVTVRYWANRAQIQDARGVAIRQLSAVLYGDMLSIIASLESAIMNGDAREAMALGREAPGAHRGRRLIESDLTYAHRTV